MVCDLNKTLSRRTLLVSKLAWEDCLHCRFHIKTRVLLICGHTDHSLTAMHTMDPILIQAMLFGSILRTQTYKHSLLNYSAQSRGVRLPFACIQ